MMRRSTPGLPGRPRALQRVAALAGFATAMLSMLLAGCVQTPVVPETVPALPTPAEKPALYQPAIDEPYRLQPGDVLAVRSYADPALNQELTVRSDGRVTPVLIGDLEAADMSPEELRRRLLLVYRQLSPQVDVVVSVVRASGQLVYLSGEVRKPSMQRIEGHLTVLQAIAMAGGLLPSAQTSEVLLVRRVPGGMTQVMKMDIDRVLRNEAPDVYLTRSDVIHVPKTAIANVGTWVDQYINAVIPRSVLFTLGYYRFSRDTVEVVSQPATP